MRFSERIGKKEPKFAIQLDSMDKELRNGLWNVITFFLTEPMKRDNSLLSYSIYESTIKEIWSSFLKEPIDQIHPLTEVICSQIRDRFFKWDYLQVYDFVDFLGSLNTFFPSNFFLEAINSVLKSELSGYRFVNGILAPITNEIEILEIEKSLSSTSALKGVNIHLSEALSKLSNKKDPDYRNSIKESISAVESLCQQLTGDEKAELSKTLKLLKTKIPLHSALEQGFIKIYSYTSDGDGIRHALLDETSLDQEDALFMLVSCSAFINYLIAKSDKAGIKFKK